MSSKHDAIEAQSKALRDDRRREEDEARGTRFGQQILDTEVYEENARSGYLQYLPGTNDDDDEDEDYQSSLTTMKLKQYGPSADIRQNIPNIDQNYDPLAEHRRPTIADRENEYQKKRRVIPGMISPERLDYFADDVWLHGYTSSTYALFSNKKEKTLNDYQRAVQSQR